MRRITLGFCVLALIGCGSPEPQPISQRDPTATIEAAAAPTATLLPLATATSQAAASVNARAIPPRPAPFAAYPQTIADWINAASGNSERLPELLDAWGLTAFQPINKLQGDAVRTADLDGDGDNEILLALPAPEAVNAIFGNGVLVVFDRDPDGAYTPKIRSGAYPNPIRILEIADFNNDGTTELLTQAIDCGAHTCQSTYNILRWSAAGWEDVPIRDLAAGEESPGTELPSATAMLEDRDGDGVRELIVSGGLIDSLGAGLQRSVTKVFAWNGSDFRLTSITPDPAASQHPYFKLLDGNAAFETGDYDRAAQLYADAIALPYPATDDVWKSSQGAVRAFARLRLIQTHLLRGDPLAANAAYVVAQRDDSAYAAWSAAFWQAYHATSTMQQACAATTAEIEREPRLLDPLNVFGYANPTFAAADICALPPSDQPPSDLGESRSGVE